MQLHEKLNLLFLFRNKVENFQNLNVEIEKKFFFMHFLDGIVQ